MDAAVQVNNLWKSFRVKSGGLFRRRVSEIVALRGVSFTIEWGQVYCLLGPNGAGKTTTVKIISTLLVPDRGWARVGGYDCVREALEVRRLLGVMLSVERGFFWKLTGRENLRYFGMLYGVERSVLDEKIDEVLVLTGLKELGGDTKRFEDMSLGMRARLGIARALLKDPRVLVLDEPTLGLDPLSARAIRSLIRRQAVEGKGVLVTTHNMFEAERICDRVGIIVEGKIVAEGTVDELKSRVGSKTSISIRVAGDPVLVERLAGRFNGIREAEGDLWRIRVTVARGEEYVVLERLLGEARLLGLKIVEARVEEPSLEDVFIEVAGGGKWR